MDKKKKWFITKHIIVDSASGFIAGFFIIHPVSVILIGNHNLFSLLSWNLIFSHLFLPMGMYFGILGFFFGLVIGIFHYNIKEKNAILRNLIDEKDTMLRIFSHDLINYIGTSVSFLTLINSGMLKTGISEKLKRIEQSLHNSMELMDHIKTILAVESGKIKPKMKRCEIINIIKKSAVLFEEKAEQKNIHFQFDCKQHKVYLNLDPIIFKNTIINNLLSNAVKFSLPGHPVIIGCYNKGKAILISFRNTGVYIPPEKIKSLFSTRITTSTSGTAGERGSGFGLPLVKKFTNLLNGVITINCIQNPEDKNSGTITVLLKFPGITLKYPDINLHI